MQKHAKLPKHACHAVQQRTSRAPRMPAGCRICTHPACPAGPAAAATQHRGQGRTRRGPHCSEQPPAAGAQAGVTQAAHAGAARHPILGSGQALNPKPASLGQADHFQVASECSRPCGGGGRAAARGDGSRSPAFCVPVSAARTLSYMLLRVHPDPAQGRPSGGRVAAAMGGTSAPSQRGAHAVIHAPAAPPCPAQGRLSGGQAASECCRNGWRQLAMSARRTCSDTCSCPPQTRFG